MNKKGFGITGIVLLVLAGIAFLVGTLGTIKIASVVNSIPTWGWVGILILLLFLILPNKGGRK